MEVMGKSISGKWWNERGMICEMYGHKGSDVSEVDEV